MHAIVQVRPQIPADDTTSSASLCKPAKSKGRSALDDVTNGGGRARQAEAAAKASGRGCGTGAGNVTRGSRDGALCRPARPAATKPATAIDAGITASLDRDAREAGVGGDGAGDGAGGGAASVDIDSGDAGDVCACTDYVKDIYRHYLATQARLQPQPDYMKRLTDLNTRMREKLVDWLVDVHLKFKLSRETLYLTVNVMDRFLQAAPVRRQQLQLVGVTAMLLAAKYEEIYAPEVSDFEYITDSAFGRDEILAMETVMLNALRFDFTTPTAYVFVTRALKASGADQAQWYLAHYLTERTLQEYAMLRFLPSEVAAGAVFVARTALSRRPWSAALQCHTGYTAAAVMPVANAVLAVGRAARTAKFNAVARKYASRKYLRVSSIALPDKLHRARRAREPGSPDR